MKLRALDRRDDIGRRARRGRLRQHDDVLVAPSALATVATASNASGSPPLAK